MLDGSLGKMKYYAIRIKFHKIDSPHVSSSKWIFRAANTENGAA